MKPKTEYEKRVVRLANKLKPITADDERFFIRNAVDTLFFDNGKITTCNRCGHQFVSVPWKGRRVITCPCCENKGRLQKSKRTTYKDLRYVAVLTTVEDIQVVRMYLQSYNWRLDYKGPGYIDWNEAFRLFVNNEGKIAIMARKIHMMPRYIDSWNFSTEIELRQDHARYYISPWLSRVHSITPWLKMRGFSGDFHGLTPMNLLGYLVNDSKCETLFKSKMYEMCCYINKSQVHNCWDEIKIVLRNSYKIKDVSMWFDLIHDLRELGLDTHNSHYICPDDLNEAHDRYMRLVERKLEKERMKYERENIRKENAKYEKRMKCYLGLMFGDESLQLHVLKDVQEFFDEGTAMNHCVYTNRYYERDDTLIMSARSYNKRLATIELNLKTMKVIQVRGACNTKPERDQEIRSMIANNIPVIMKAKRKQLK